MLWPVYIRLQWEVTSVCCVAVIADRNSYGRRFRLNQPYWVHPQWSRRGHVQSCHLCTWCIHARICLSGSCILVFLLHLQLWWNHFMCLNVRYTVVLNGREAIREALVKQSLEFSDRPEYKSYTDVFNVHTKGKCCLMLCLCQPESFNTFKAV